MSRFVIAESLAQALDTLAGGDARIMAGGTDFMLHLRELAQRGQEPPKVILDVSRVPELKRLDLEPGSAYLGAGLTFRFIEGDPRIAESLPLLSQAAATVGSRQIRQTATIGGNAGNASPAADGVTALMALGAEAKIASAKGSRSCPLAEIFKAPYKTTLPADELIVGFSIPRPPAPAGQVFFKVGRRQAVAVARLNLGVCLDKDLVDPRVVLGSCFPTPRRLAEVEELIKAGKPGPELWHEAGVQAAKCFVDVCGLRPSATYKNPAITRATAATLARAWQQAGGEA